MVFKRIKEALTRPPIPVSGAPTNASDSANEAEHARKSILVVGHPDSAMRLSMLEMLREAVKADPSTIRGLIVGLPLDRVERTLASAGLNPVENLLSLNASRSLLRFEHPETGTFWHINRSEFARVDSAGEYRPGTRIVVSPDLPFNDWARAATPAASGQPVLMRNLTTGRECPRPDTLVFRQDFRTQFARATYDGIAGDITPDEVMDRLRIFGSLGLNAFIFLKNLVLLVRLSGESLTTPVLYSLVIDIEKRQRLIEFLSASLDSLPEQDQRTAGEVIETLMETGDNVPPMALTLVTELYDQAWHDRVPHPVADFLVPGKLWHIDTDTAADRYIAHCIKRDVQRAVLLSRPGIDTTVILTASWADHIVPALDGACLNRPDMFQCHGITDAGVLLEKHGENIYSIIRAFPRHAWHLSIGDADVELFDKTYPFVAHSRQQIAFLPWEKRLHETEGRIREVAIDLNVDGIEIQERARRTKLKRTIERGGYAM